MRRSNIDIKEMIKFGFVGGMNTLIGTAVMFFAYNALGLGYWVSSALNYIVGSIFSYFANKYFTFKSKKKSLREVLRFAVNIAVCYLIAYGIAEPLVKRIGYYWEWGFSTSVLEQIAMVMGMCLFVVLNYFGQKLFVFRSCK